MMTLRYYSVVVLLSLLCDVTETTYDCVRPCNNKVSDSSVNCTRSCTEECPSIEEWRQIPYKCKSDFPLDVTLFPYKYLTSHSYDYSAINVSITFNTSEVQGFILTYFNTCMALNGFSQCRKFEFGNTKNKNDLLTAHYEEMWFQNNEGNKCYAFEITTWPDKICRKSYIFNTLWSNHLDMGLPLVVLERSSYNGSMLNSSLVFPSTINVTLTNYTVQLIDQSKNNEVLQAESIIYDQNKQKYPLLWRNLEHFGPYSILYTGCNNTHCFNVSSPTLELLGMATLNYNQMQTLLISGMVFISLTLFLLIVLLFTRRNRSHLATDNKNGKKVFIMYSHDTKLHVNVVEAFASYLMKRCGFSVIIDKWDLQSQSPFDWLNKSISSADCILIIWSKGAHFKTQKTNKRLKNEPEHLGGDLFSSAYGISKTELQKELEKIAVIPIKSTDMSRKFCHVFFPYVPISIANSAMSQLNYLHKFQIPNNMHNLVSYISSRGTGFQLPRCSLCGDCRDLVSNDLENSEEGINLLDSIKAMAKFDNERPDWFEESIIDLPNNLALKHTEVNSSSLHSMQTQMSRESNNSESDSLTCLINNNDCHSSDSSEDEEEFPPKLRQLPVFGVTV